jgi:sporulation protein YlmC with PRC-barrel domain
LRFFWLSLPFPCNPDTGRMKAEVPIELLLGRRILSRNGKSIGRIEEVCYDENNQVTEFLTGTRALLARLAALGLFRDKKRGYRIRWDQLDWSKSEQPQLTCEVDELTRFS